MFLLKGLAIPHRWSRSGETWLVKIRHRKSAPLGPASVKETTQGGTLSANVSQGLTGALPTDRDTSPAAPPPLPRCPTPADVE